MAAVPSASPRVLALSAAMQYETETLDPFRESIDALVVIVFPKADSPHLPFVLSIAQQASRFALTDIGGKGMYVAAFAKEQSDAGRALAVLQRVAGWKGVSVFVRGRMLKLDYNVGLMLDCYLGSCACRDPRAHCQRVIDDPSHEPPGAASHRHVSLRRESMSQREIQVKRYIFPCQKLLTQMRFEPDHPSSYADQIQAAGVTHMCGRCPRFDPDDFQEIGVRSYFVED